MRYVTLPVSCRGVQCAAARERRATYVVSHSNAPLSVGVACAARSVLPSRGQLAGAPNLRTELPRLICTIPRCVQGPITRHYSFAGAA